MKKTPNLYIMPVTFNIFIPNAIKKRLTVAFEYF